jgi:hypothetical protein
MISPIQKQAGLNPAPVSKQYIFSAIGFIPMVIEMVCLQLLQNEISLLHFVSPPQMQEYNR